MNLGKLFETQRILDELIMENHPELRVQENLDWKVLALQVELGECANEWRGFKKWSNDQEPRTSRFAPGVADSYNYNPLLEEYVDCLHFILAIGLELNIQNSYADEVNFNIGSRAKRTFPTDQFRNTFRKVALFDMHWNEQDYMEVVEAFVTLGDSLGFTEEEVEEAYFKKNEINHGRQESGY